MIRLVFLKVEFLLSGIWKCTFPNMKVRQVILTCHQINIIEQQLLLLCKVEVCPSPSAVMGSVLGADQVSFSWSRTLCTNANVLFCQVTALMNEINQLRQEIGELETALTQARYFTQSVFVLGYFTLLLFYHCKFYHIEGSHLLSVIVWILDQEVYM